MPDPTETDFFHRADKDDTWTGVPRAATPQPGGGVHFHTAGGDTPRTTIPAGRGTTMGHWQARAEGDKSPVGVNEVLAVGLGVVALVRIRNRRKKEAREREAAERAKQEGHGEDSGGESTA